ncbi:hypothetical protein AB0O00_22945, partial [Kitasatospora sp. NPDC093558]
MGDGAGKADGVYEREPRGAGEPGVPASGPGLTPDPTPERASDLAPDITTNLTTNLTTDLTSDLTSDLTTDELAVRDLMHRAVAGIQPAPGSLPRIRTAVPRRRAARRGALTGAVALAAAVAIGLPALHSAD